MKILNVILFLSFCSSIEAQDSPPSSPRSQQSEKQKEQPDPLETAVTKLCIDTLSEYPQANTKRIQSRHRKRLLAPVDPYSQDLY